MAETDKEEVVMHDLRQMVKDVSREKLINVENEYRTGTELLTKSNEEVIAAMNKNRKEIDKAMETKAKEIEVNLI